MTAPSTTGTTPIIHCRPAVSKASRPANERHRRRAERNHPRLATLGLPRSGDQRIGGEQRVKRAGEREQLLPLAA